MLVGVGINGFGRIGRRVLKALRDFHGDTVRVVAINGRGDPATSAHLLKYDSNYGPFPGQVEAEGDALRIDGDRIPVLSESDPREIAWGEHGVDIVMECTGKFRTAEKARRHLEKGAKKVVISSPAKGEDITIVLGVNEESYEPDDHHIVSNASCTTNCVAPVVKVLHEAFGLERGFVTAIHSYTNDQRLLDNRHKDLRRARAGALNIIPTTTGAARAVARVMPELAGRIDGMAFRVPTPTVSVVDLVATLEKQASVQEVNRAFVDAASGDLRGILEFTNEELVSSDFKGNPASAIVDGPSTMLMGGRMVKAVSWYDNEWGYACRLADLCAFLVGRGL